MIYHFLYGFNMVLWSGSCFLFVCFFLKKSRMFGSVLVKHIRKLIGHERKQKKDPEQQEKQNKKKSEFLKKN